MSEINSAENRSALLERLVENHRRFMAFLRPRVRSPEDAEEILQSAFSKAAAKEDTLRDQERATAWFYRLLRNALADYYRRRGAEQRQMEALHQLAMDDATPDPELERTVCECLGDLIPTLKPEYAELLERVELHGASVADAARALNISPNNASVRLHRARLALRERLVESCGTCTEHGCLDCCCKAS